MDDATTIACRVCGTEFVSVPTTRRYCSPACFSQRKRLTYVSGSYTRPKPKERRPCAWCGKDFDYHPKLRVRYCSRSCGASAQIEGASCPVPWRMCNACGAAFISRTRRLTCSDACRRRAAYTPVSGAPITATCGRCGVTYETVRRQGSHRCEECLRDARQADRRRRNALKRGARSEPYSRFGIFERDRWRCQLCGSAVLRRRVVPHPKAPVIDHIVPLARGGDDVPSNVQCAHFLCNSLKGHRVFGNGDQLRLLG